MLPLMTGPQRETFEKNYPLLKAIGELFITEMLGTLI